MNPKQQGTIERIKTAIVEMKSCGKPDKYEFKQFKIVDDGKLVFLVTEYGMIGDEGTMASLMVRDRRMFMIRQGRRRPASELRREPPKHEPKGHPRHFQVRELLPFTGKERGFLMRYTATYSPDDNKLRLYASSRLDAETYAKVKAAGFRWAPKQELFVAPAWTPAREDLLIDLAGEIEDEDKSLVERAEERAERFEDYSEARTADAESARKAVAAIADNIPFGQPILIGHHSEKRARRDKEKIDNGMRKAVKMWNTANYWQGRAAGAIAAAKYKELPAVRHRRIKGLESDKRKAEKNKQEAAMWLHLWTECGNEPDKELQAKVALRIAGGCWLHLPRKEGDREDLSHNPTAHDVLSNSYPTLYAPRSVDEVVEYAKKVYPANIAHYERWIAHYENRLVYERAMLNEQIGNGEIGSGFGGRFDIKPGGKVLTRGEWLVVIRVNKSNGAINSVTTQAPASVHWAKTWKYSIEKIVDYQPPTEEMAAKVKKATALPPICNYPGDGFREMTQAEWAAMMKRKWSDFPYYGVARATDTAGCHRFRQVPAGMMKKQQVFLTDAKVVMPPKPEPKSPENALPAPQPRAPVSRPQTAAREVPDDIEAMRQALKGGGAQVVVANQLFPTPPDLAERAVELAEIEPSHRVLEPSAGTGRLVDALGAVPGAKVVAVEISPTIADNLRLRSNTKHEVRCADFLECNGDLGKFDRIVMNPPFERGADIKHIKHALGFLKPGGRLVAICANGPRQQEQLKPLASHWEELPSGTFSGTGVNAALLAIDAGGGAP